VTKAIVMINTEVGKEDEILETLYNLEEVKDVFLVYGIHDIVAIVEAETMDKLRNLITEKIRRLDGVKNTLTSIVVTHRTKRTCETPPEKEQASA